MREKRTHIEIFAPLLEMAAADASLLKIDPDLVSRVTDGDPDPRFVFVDIDECTSANNVVYDHATFQMIANQVNEKQPVGYLGHKHFQGADKDDLLPDPQAIWLAATAVKGSDGAKFLAKGYLLPDAKARDWIKRQAINTVSWAGDAILVPASKGGYRIKEYVLESIDFARKNKAGLKNQRLVVVTEEFHAKASGRGGTRVDEPTYEEVVARLVFADLKAHNPALVKTITEMAKDEVKDETKVAVAEKEEELTEKFQKDIEKNPDITMMQKIRDLLGIKDDSNLKPDEAVVALLERLDDLGKKIVGNWFKTEVLEKKVPNEKARAIIGRLIPVTEMKGDFRTESGIEKIKKELEDKADDLIDNDDAVQTVIKEMGATRGGLRLTEHTRGGGERERERNDDGGHKETSNLRPEKVRMS